MDLEKVCKSAEKEGINQRSGAREMAEALEIEMTLPNQRQRTTTRRCLYEGREEIKFTLEERFNSEFFVDAALCSIRNRFAQT